MMRTQELSILLILILFFQLKTGAQAIDKKGTLDIVFIGNSITFGALLENPLEESPPSIASEYLRQQISVGDIDFINQGRSGFTTVDYLPSTTGTFMEVITATKKLHKDNHRLLIFSISLGTNDSAEMGPNGSPVSPEEYYKNLRSISDRLLIYFPECKIVLQQPIWYSSNTYNGAKYMNEGLSRLQKYFPELEKLVIYYSQNNPNHVFIGDQKGFPYFKNNYLTDLIPEQGKKGIFYLHPNKKGAIVLGKLWGEAIYEKVVKD